MRNWVVIDFDLLYHTTSFNTGNITKGFLTATLTCITYKWGSRFEAVSETVPFLLTRGKPFELRSRILFSLFAVVVSCSHFSTLQQTPTREKPGRSNARHGIKPSPLSSAVNRSLFVACSKGHALVSLFFDISASAATQHLLFQPGHKLPLCCLLLHFKRS